MVAPPLRPRVTCLLVVPLVVGVTVSPCSGQILQYADRAPDRTESVGDPGLLTLFDAGRDDRWLNAVEVFASAQGQPTAEFSLYVVDLDGRLMRRVRLPCSLLASGGRDWRMLPLPPMKVPREFGVALVGSSEGNYEYGGRMLHQWGAQPLAPVFRGDYNGGFLEIQAQRLEVRHAAFGGLQAGKFVRPGRVELVEPGSIQSALPQAGV